jgi:hypothetical protein
MRQASCLYLIARVTLAFCVMSQVRTAPAQDKSAAVQKQPAQRGPIGQIQKTNGRPAVPTQSAGNPSIGQTPKTSVAPAPAPSAGKPSIGQIAKTNGGPASGQETTSGQAILTLRASAQIAQPNQPIQFTLTWNRPVYRVTYVFDWGDKTGSEESANLTAQHAYSSAGQYTVRATAHSVVKAASAGDPTSNPVTIQVPFPEKSSATLTADKLNIHPGDSVAFSATAYPNAADAQYTYDFGDGTTPQAGSNQAGHTYNVLGIFHATVTVLSHDGEQSAVSPPVEIGVTAAADVTPTPAPTVRVTSLNTTGLVAGDEAVVSASLDPPQKIAGFEFDWGDGSAPQKVSSSGTANHKYLTSGTYNVVVTAETATTYNPPLAGSIRLDVLSSGEPSQNTGEPSTPLWVKIGIAAAGALILGLIVRAILHRSPRPKLRYVPKAGLSTNEISLRRDSQTRSSSSDPFRLRPGMGGAEHTLKFRR